MPLQCRLIGSPVQSGANQHGCLMGPDAYRTAEIADVIKTLGHNVEDIGNLSATEHDGPAHPNSVIHDLNETIGWARTLEAAAHTAVTDSTFPIFLGGDHSLSIGTVPGVTRAATDAGKEQFVLWLDAHSDFHTLSTTTSGNLHGTPMAYCTGQPGFDGYYPELAVTVPVENVCMMGIRSVDDAERAGLARNAVTVVDMRALDEHGIVKPLASFISKVKSADGALHVSLDVDFLEPEIAPAVGTTVPGGATFREAHLIMEMLCDADVVTSLDLVELNPFLDDRGRTAKLMVDLCASLLGRKVLDRRTRSY